MRASVLACPKCGASLRVQPGARIVECDFCRTNVVVTPDDETPRRAAPPARNAMVLVAVGASVLTVLAVALVVLTRGDAKPSGPAIARPPVVPPEPATTSPAATARPEPAPAPPPPPAASAASPAEPDALADVSLEFGEKGSGPGQLDDARAIAVDPGGDI